MTESPPRCPKNVGATMEDATFEGVKRGDLSAKTQHPELVLNKGDTTKRIYAKSVPEQTARYQEQRMLNTLCIHRQE